jgi:hypothetical protein
MIDVLLRQGRPGLLTVRKRDLEHLSPWGREWSYQCSPLGALVRSRYSCAAAPNADQAGRWLP